MTAEPDDPVATCVCGDDPRRRAAHGREVRALHDDVLRLAVSDRVEATDQQQVLARMLDAGVECEPSAVVAALLAGLRAADGLPGIGEGAVPDDEDVDRARRRLRALGARLLVVGEPGYPVPLQPAWPESGAPVWLFAVGDVELADAPAVAVVGTRKPSADGLRTADAVAGALARAGIVVVSGLARGIDQAAHRGALDAGGRTIAVLGSGLGIDYPARSADLRRGIAGSGGLVTEYAPGVPARRWRFLMRNRIISGLSDATVVVEGRSVSGALQTARLAGSQGRTVWAVPGSINAPTSAAPLALLRDGATPLTSIDAFMEDLEVRDVDRPAPGGSRASVPDPARASTAGLSWEARAVLDLLSGAPATTDALVSASTLPARTVLVAVAELVDRGLAATTPHGTVRGRGAP